MDIFVYAKNGKIKALETSLAKKHHKGLISTGHVLTASLDICMFLEHLCNEKTDAEKLEALANLKSINK